VAGASSPIGVIAPRPVTATLLIAASYAPQAFIQRVVGNTTCMAVAQLTAAQTPAARPRLVVFTSGVSGHCRRVEGFLAQVLQRRRNHGTFKVVLVDERKRPDLLERFGIDVLPTLVVVTDKAVRAKLERPRGCKEIEQMLGPWLL
jgi:thioredoxin-like negative regulator of GroEL